MLTGTTAAPRRWPPRSAIGALLVAAGAVYLLAEGIAASAFSPRYSYARNYISDLGVAACGEIFDGRPICSPLHAVMDAGFILSALCFLAAAVVCLGRLSGWWRYVFVALVGIHAAGNGLVGVFPETGAAVTGAARWHVFGAALAIIGGNTAILSSAPLSKALGLPALNRFACILFPIVGVVALRMLIVARSPGAASVLPDGTWERISVYAITFWQLLTGACLLATRRR